MLNVIDITATTIEQSWSAITTLTSVMHDTARQEEWFMVVEQASARHEKIMAHFTRFPVGPDYSGFYRQHLPVLLESETQLKDIVVAARREIMRQGLSLSHNRRALGAYANNLHR